MEAMNSVEDLQHKAQAKQTAAVTGPSQSDTKVEPKQAPIEAAEAASKTSESISSLQSSASKLEAGSPAEATV